MDHTFSRSSQLEAGCSNVISLHDRGNAVTPSAQTVLELASDARVPEGYFAEPDGIYFQGDPDSQGPVWICSRVAVVGLCRRLSGKGWSRVVNIDDPDGRMHRLLLDEPLFNGAPAALLRPLLDCGLRIAKGDAARKQVADLLSAWRPRDVFVRVPRVGWLDGDFDTFVCADGEVVGRRKVILERDTGIIGEMAGSSGSLELWQEHVAAACVGNPLMLLAVSQAFVGPLLGPLGLDGGGFHFRGASSRGKTTLLTLAASVWGAPGYVQSWRTTDNAIESVASCCSSALLALDELHLVSPQVAGDIVYMLANGRGKQRMTSRGTTKSTDSWHVATLSSGEIDLEEHLASGGKRIFAGQEIRLIDIEADGRRFGAFDVLHGETAPGGFVEKLLQGVAQNHGHAGRIFVAKLIENMDSRDRMNSFMKRFVTDTVEAYDLKGDGQVTRVLRRFAVTALAGELATNFGVTGWQRGVAKNAIQRAAGVWLTEREAARATLVASALERTRSYLTANSHRFLPCGSTGDVAGWRDDTWIYIRPETWSRIHGVDGVQEAARLHKAANMLRTDKGESLQFRMGRTTPGRPKVYAVSVGVLET